MKALYRFVFKKRGWKIVGSLPKETSYVLIVAPHTSNWDFLIGIGARAVLNFWPRYAGKKELFVWPLGWLMRKLGGYPVERSKNTNFVENFAEIFQKEKDFVLTLTPEGTRSYNPDWKTGFYFIAKKAGVPIVPVAFDYKTKSVILHEAVYPTMPVEDLVAELKTWYSQFEGKNPEGGVQAP